MAFKTRTQEIGPTEAATPEVRVEKGEAKGEEEISSVTPPSVENTHPGNYENDEAVEVHPSPAPAVDTEEITKAIKVLTSKVIELEKTVATQPELPDKDFFDKLLNDKLAAVKGRTQIPAHQDNRQPQKSLFDKLITFIFWFVFGVDVMVLIPWLAYSHFNGNTYKELETIRYDIIHPNGDAYMPDGKTIFTHNGIVYQIMPNPSPKDWDRTQRVQNEIDYMREQAKKNPQQ